MLMGAGSFSSSATDSVGFCGPSELSDGGGTGTGGTSCWTKAAGVMGGDFSLWKEESADAEGSRRKKSCESSWDGAGKGNFSIGGGLDGTGFGRLGTGLGSESREGIRGGADIGGLGLL